MSVDIFGRSSSVLKRAGPPGPQRNGFKITVDGQFDVDRKRRCIIGSPMDKDDAVSVKVVEHIIEQESGPLSQITTLLREDVDDNASKITGMESYVQGSLGDTRDKVMNIRNLVSHTSAIISQLEARVTTLEATVNHLTKKGNSSDSVHHKLQ